MSSWELYWITRLDGIFYVLLGVMLLCAVGWLLIAAIMCAAKLADDDDTAQCLVTPFLISLCLLAFFGIATALCPTTKEMVLIKVVPPLVNSEVAQKIPNDLTDLYNWAIKEIKARAKEEVGK